MSITAYERPPLVVCLECRHQAMQMLRLDELTQLPKEWVYWCSNAECPEVKKEYLLPAWEATVESTPRPVEEEQK